MQDPKSLPPGLPASLMSMINKSVAAASGGGKMNDTSKVQKVDTETPQQKQAAAKLALRKQLEKTLLQVRFPLFSNCRWVFVAPGRYRPLYDRIILLRFVGLY